MPRPDRAAESPQPPEAAVEAPQSEATPPPAVRALLIDEEDAGGWDWLHRTTLGACLAPVFGVTLVHVIRASGNRLVAYGSVAAVLGTLALLIFLQHRAARRRVRAGGPLWEAEWRDDRTLLRRGWATTTVPGWLRWVAVLAISIGISLVVSRTPWQVRVAAACAPLLFFCGGYAWIVARGRPLVRLDRFPYFLGERATFWIATTEGSPRLTGTSVRLKCRTLNVRIPETGKKVFSRLHWSDVRTLPPHEPPGPDEFVAVTFDVPPGAPGTELHAPQPVVWELTVRGRGRWGAVEETFVVPVYAPPPGDAATPAN